MKDIPQHISISERIADQIHKNRTPILGFIVLILVSIASYSIYHHYQEKYEAEAQVALFDAERLMNAHLSMGEFAKENATNIDTTQLEEKLQSIINEFPKTKARMQASILLSEVYLQKDDTAKAIATLEHSFEYFKGDLLDTLVGLKLTSYYERNKQCDKALPVLETLTKTDIQEFKPETLLRQGLCQELLGNTENAKQSFQKLATEYGDTVQGQQAQKYLKVM